MNTYIFHISLYDLAFLGTIFIGLGFALQLWFTKRVNRAANRFLALTLLTIVLWMVWVLGIDVRLGTYFPHWSWLPLQFSLALGPLIFFYVLKITRPQYKFRWKDLLHFSPLLLQLGILVLEVRASLRTGAATYDTLTFQQLNPVLQLLAFVSVIIYLYLAHRLIERFYQRLKFNGGDRYRYELRWLHRLLLGFGLLWLLWIPFSAADYFYYHNQLSIHAYYPLYLLLAAMAIWMAAIAFLRPEAGLLVTTDPFLKAPLPSEMKQRGIWLKKTVQAKLYYQDPELSLSSLAQKLELGPHELSRIINVALKKNFNDFINEYRVRDVTRMMQDPAYDHITLLGIAYESGFNSQSTFTRIFKHMTGKNPLEYKNELKKDFPTYNLGSRKGFAAVISNQKLNRNFMFRNYFKTAWRNLLRNKNYTAINVTGLAIGIAACLLIFLVVQYETSFDNFHVNKDRIYRVVTVSHGPDGVTIGSGTQLPLADGLRLDFPELTHVSSIMLNDGSNYSIGNTKKFKADSAYYADPQFFQIFDFKWLAGDKKTALAGPNAVVLTRGEADKFFGDWHTAIGKTIKYANKRDFKVTGIIENTPANTDFPMKVVMSWITLVEKGGDLSGNSQDWISTFSDRNTYIVLPVGMSEKRFNGELESFAKKHIPPPYNKTSSLQLQALEDMHYNTQVDVYGGHPFSKQLINVISLIGLFLLIIACVNFINLATAQAVNRSKEVGIRKVLGSNRYQLVLQFISETLLITLFAIIIASSNFSGYITHAQQLA